MLKSKHSSIDAELDSQQISKTTEHSLMKTRSRAPEKACEFVFVHTSINKGY